MLVHDEREGTKDAKFNGLTDQSDVITTFKNIETALINSVVIKGIKGITNIVMDVGSNSTTEHCCICLEKNDIVSLIDCEHSFTFSKDTILHEIKQGPYIKNEKIIYD